MPRYIATRRCRTRLFWFAPNVSIVLPANTSLFIAQREQNRIVLSTARIALSSCYTRPANNRVSHAVNRTPRTRRVLELNRIKHVLSERTNFTVQYGELAA